jgi:hypothetical protein
MKMCEYNYIHPGFIFIPCRGMTPGGLRAQYLIPKLTPKCECLSIHSSLPLGPRHHAIPQNQRKQSLCRTEANCRPQAPLPNLLKKSSSARRDFFTKLGPQIRLPSVPNFGVNTHQEQRHQKQARKIPQNSQRRIFYTNQERITRSSLPP